jgi:4-hydroxybenzoate polyprenyltransferase
MTPSRIRTALEMIKFEHSVFALPFALTGMLLAARSAGLPHNLPTLRQFLWIVVAMVAARSAAMTFNRIADRDLDAANPRTRTRALVAGQLSVGFAWAFTFMALVLLFLAAWQLNPLALKLAPAAAAILLLYSYTKRFTVWSHFVLGFCLGMSPMAAWIAVRGTFEPRMLILVAAVTLWVAGFDILYACQDVEFDRQAGLYSLPTSVGISKALLVARLLHIFMVALLLWLARVWALGGLAYAGIAAVGALLAYEHSLVKPQDLSKINAAFFTVNGYISLLFLAFWGAAILVSKA